MFIVSYLASVWRNGNVEQALSLCFERQLWRRADALICRRCLRRRYGVLFAASAALTVAGCAVQPALASDFTVSSNSMVVPVHVAGATLGANTADLDAMIKNAAECGLARSADAHTLQPGLRMVWSVNGLVRPGLSSVSLRLHMDGMPDQVNFERVNLQAEPRTMFVRELCEMTTSALVSLHREANVRAAQRE